MAMIIPMPTKIVEIQAFRSAQRPMLAGSVSQRSTKHAVSSANAG